VASLRLAVTSHVPSASDIQKRHPAARVPTRTCSPLAQPCPKRSVAAALPHAAQCYKCLRSSYSPSPVTNARQRVTDKCWRCHSQTTRPLMPSSRTGRCRSWRRPCCARRCRSPTLTRPPPLAPLPARQVLPRRASPWAAGCPPPPRCKRRRRSTPRSARTSPPTRRTPRRGPGPARSRWCRPQPPSTLRRGRHGVASSA
jgi:hypothetical protein